MFQRFHEKRRDEEGFTLIELLVVILIIAILAAIAIPVFLRQREKGWVGQSESALKNAATAMESYSTGNNGAYPAVGAEAALVSEGFRPVADAPVTIDSSSSSGYCLEAIHANLPAGHASKTMKFNSNTGAPADGACP